MARHSLARTPPKSVTSIVRAGAQPRIADRVEYARTSLLPERQPSDEPQKSFFQRAWENAAPREYHQPPAEDPFVLPSWSASWPEGASPDVPRYGPITNPRTYQGAIPSDQPNVALPDVRSGWAPVENRTDALGRTGFGAGSPETDDTGAMARRLAAKAQESISTANDYYGIMGAYEQELAELTRLRLEAAAAGRDDVIAEYDKEIGRVQEKIGEAEVGMKQAMAAYQHYAEQVGPAMQAAVDAGIEGEQLMADAFEGKADESAANVTETYDEMDEAIDEGLSRMTPGGNVAEAVAEAMSGFEDMYTDQAREQIDDLSALSAAGAKFATATAKQLQAEDAYMTDVERQKVEIAINKRLDDLRENVERLEEDKKAAAQKAYDDIYNQWGPVEGFDDPYAAFDYTLDEYGARMGWSFEELDAVRASVEQLRGAGVTDLAGGRAWVADQVVGLNEELLSNFLLNNGAADWVDEEGNPMAPGWAPLVEQIAANPAAAIKNGTMGTLISAMNAQGANVTEEDVASLAWGKTSDYDNVLEGLDLWNTHVKSWDDRKKRQSYVTGNAAADHYGFQGGTGTQQGKQYVGAELDQLLMEAATYVFGDEKTAQQWVLSGGLQKVIRGESNGVIGIVNYLGWKEAGLDSKYDTAGYIDAAVRASKGDWSGFTPSRDGKSHSAAGLGQLNAGNYATYASEFGGAKSLGNPFVEAVAMIRYVKARFGTPGAAWRFKQKAGNY